MYTEIMIIIITHPINVIDVKCREPAKYFNFIFKKTCLLFN